MSHEHAVIARLLALVEPVRHSWIWCFSFHDAHHEEVGGGAFSCRLCSDWPSVIAPGRITAQGMARPGWGRLHQRALADREAV